MKNTQKIFCILLVALLLCSCEQNVPPTTTPTTTSTIPSTTQPEATTQVTVPATTQPYIEPTAAPVEDRLPQISDKAVRMYYDDRLAISDLGGNATSSVTISQEAVTSTATDGSGADGHVIIWDETSGDLIAVGIGSAVITVDGTAYHVSVESAPISLVLIIGHSIGAGQTGVPAESVLCEPGQAYSTHYLPLKESDSAGVGIGYAASSKPENIDALTAPGNGVQGSASGLAYRWNQLTGEKIWVLNAAKGGSCLNEWVQGSKNYQMAVDLFRYAEAVLANEIAAGHYRLKDMAVIYHSNANYKYKKVTYTDEDGKKWLDSLRTGLNTDLLMDINRDGAEETINAFGFAPAWTKSTKNSFTHDCPANYYMSVSSAYPGTFMATDAVKHWLANNGLSLFPAIDYETHGGEVYPPKFTHELFSDGVHPVQVVYNAMGIDIGANLFAHLRTYSKINSLKLMSPSGSSLPSTLTLDKAGDCIRFVAVTDPITVQDLTFKTSDNLAVEFPGMIVGLSAGEGTVTIYQGNTIVSELKVTVKG